MSDFPIKINYCSENNIKIIGTNNAPAPFVGLFWYVPQEKIWGKIVEINGDVLENLSSEIKIRYISRFNCSENNCMKFEMNQIYKSIYNSIIYGQGLVFGGTSLCPTAPITFQETFTNNDIVIFQYNRRWTSCLVSEFKNKMNFDLNYETFSFLIKKNSNIICKNNDGRTNCAWCGQPTKRINTGFSFYDVCSKCGK